MINKILNIFSYISNRKKTVKNKRKVNFEEIKRANLHSPRTSVSLDELTWNDLNLDSIFECVNNTLSSAGENLLYSWLKNPIDNEIDYRNRKNFINIMEKKSSENEKMRIKLEKVGYCKYNLIEIMESDFYSNFKLLFMHSFFSLINLYLIINTLVVGITTITGSLIILFPINMFLHFKFKEKYGSQLEVLQYSIKLVKFAKSSLEIVKKIDLDLYNEIRILTDKLKSISKNEMILFRMEGLDLVADYINVTLLLKEINYFLIVGKIQSLKGYIIELYNLIGKIDSTISVIEYRKTLNSFCEPNLNNEFEDLFIENGYHPLIEKAVPNSIRVSRNIAITGSNMSGKSTFLRTVGVNAVLSQSICTSLSTNYKSKFYRILTSLSLNDTILESKSYFLMEAEAIKRMIKNSEDGHSTLVLIDEIFKGTNPIERYAASVEILNTLGFGNTKTIVTTHDLNIIPELKGFENYYFTENITSCSLEFDFKIQRGTANTRNAVKILEYVDYPNDLIDKIYSRIKDTEKEALEIMKTC